MLQWSLAFFSIAILAALFGFGGIATGASEIAKVLFFLFIVICTVSLFGGAAPGTPPDGPSRLAGRLVQSSL